MRLELNQNFPYHFASDRIDRPFWFPGLKILIIKIRFIKIVVSSIGTVAMDLKEECGRSDNLIVETWSASGKFDRVQVCQNKVSMKKPG